MYEFQFYRVVMPYLLKEYQRKNVPNSGIRILKEDDPGINLKKLKKQSVTDIFSIRHFI